MTVSEPIESCVKELREHYNEDWDSTVPGAEFDAEIRRILHRHLGGYVVLLEALKRLYEFVDQADVTGDGKVMRDAWAAIKQAERT